jgi:hypothetical protein
MAKALNFDKSRTATARRDFVPYAKKTFAAVVVRLIRESPPSRLRHNHF